MLNRPAGPVTDELIDEAVANGLVETDDLDWKKELPSKKGLSQTDFPKDVAAMANRGGGTIVYGVVEENKAAIERVDVGEFDEGYQRALIMAAYSAITPPVFGLGVYHLNNSDKGAVIVEVPASVDVPHLIFRGEAFGGPIRYDADTVWMKERQIEAMYRTRSIERRRADEALDSLYAEETADRSFEDQAWIVVAAHPRLAGHLPHRPTRDEASGIFRDAKSIANQMCTNAGSGPLHFADLNNPRSGLRRWRVQRRLFSDKKSPFATSISVHYDGSFSLAFALGGWPKKSTFFGNDDSEYEGGQVAAAAVEATVVDVMAIIRATNRKLGSSEFEVRIGMEWRDPSPLLFGVNDWSFLSFEEAYPLKRFAPVLSTVEADADDESFLQQARELAEDCLNQGGVTLLRLLRESYEE